MISAHSLSRLSKGMAGLMLIVAVLTAVAQNQRQFSIQQPAPAQNQAAPGAQGAPAQAAPAQAPQTACGNQPYCYEAQDFAALITDFRTSTAGYYKVIDVTVRFLNKTNGTIILGYTNGSGMALDDRGNRYAVGGGNALRGIGAVNGQSFDPRFQIQPRGFGDARFELLMTPSAQTILGFNFELDLSVDEIASYEGNQHSLGSEFPLQFQGLANGVKGSAPGIPSGGSSGSSMFGSNSGASGGSMPCDPSGTVSSLAGATNSAGVQNAANTATNTASTAASAFSNLKSIFHRNSAQAPAASASAPCTSAPAAASPAAVPTTVAVPATTYATSPTTTTTPSVATPAAVAPAATTSSPVVNASQVRSTMTRPGAPLTRTPVAATRTAVPVSAVSRTPLPATAAKPTPAKPAAAKPSPVPPAKKPGQ